MKSEPLLTANFLLSTGFHKIKPEWKFFVLGSMDFSDQPEKQSLGDEKHDSCPTYLPMTQSEIWVSRPRILTTEPGYMPTRMMTKLLVRTGPDSELARMNTLVSLSPNVKRTILST